MDNSFTLTANLIESLQELDNKHVMISPVLNVGGAVSNYTKNTDLTFEEVRNAAWLNSRNNQSTKKLRLQA
ncbi:MAG: hypothetical protein COA94_07560 [Rickettsiales bacterium]|nr:MAG: hypothetical protein COA94_07560 [Rickettsiales bacterium]